MSRDRKAGRERWIPCAAGNTFNGSRYHYLYYARLQTKAESRAEQEVEAEAEARAEGEGEGERVESHGGMGAMAMGDTGDRLLVDACIAHDEGCVNPEGFQPL